MADPSVRRRDPRRRLFRAARSEGFPTWSEQIGPRPIKRASQNIVGGGE